MIRRLRLNLQMFAEGGGDGATAGSGDAVGSNTSASEGVARATKGRASNPLESVIYGKPAEDFANPTDGEQKTPEQRAKSFEELIKGEYKEEYHNRVQKNINERFKDYNKLQNTLKSQTELMDMLSDKYGVNSGDMKALKEAIESDESFYEQEAMEKGLSVEQLKQMKQLQRENEQFRKAQEEALAREEGDRIYSEWLNQGEELKAKYSLESFDLNAECENPEFVNLLRSGVTLEGAYKAVHFDDMVGGAMFKTANTVKQGLINSMTSRNARPSENGTSVQPNAMFKQDVNALTKEDRAEIMRRAARGAEIRF